MLVAMLCALVVALAAALASTIVGRNLTHSIAASFVFVAAMGLALLFGGAGFIGLVLVILTAILLGVVQLFGWMLVDVDRDHLPATDRPTSLARGIAFLILAGGLSVLFRAVLSAGELTPSIGFDAPIDSAGIGSLLFGPLREWVSLLGFSVAGGLLATLLLLQDDEGNN